MSRDGSGNFNLIAGNPVTTGTTIASTWANGTLSDIATALTNSIAKNGETIPIGNLPMGGYKHTGVANASARTDYAAYGQVQDSGSQYLTGVAGADTITASVTGLAAYATGQTFRFVSAGANTGAATLNINALGAKTIAKWGALALSAGDIASGAIVQVVYDGTVFQLVGVSRSDASPLVVGSADATKVMRMNLGNLTTASTRTLTMVDKSGTVWLPEDFSGIHNATLTATTVANAITFALKTKAGNDPSNADPVFAGFRSSTITSGTLSVLSVTSALSVTLPSGQACGANANETVRLHVWIANNGGTPALVIGRTVSTAAATTGGGYDCTGILRLAEGNTVNTSAISGAANALTLYSGGALTGVALAYLGYIEVGAGSPAGTWGSPSVVTTWKPGTPRPGEVVQYRYANSRAVDAAGTNPIPWDDTIPQNTEGKQYLSQAISCSSALNVCEVHCEANMSVNSAIHITMALWQDSTADAFDAMAQLSGNANLGRFVLTSRRIVGTASSTTYAMRAGPESASTLTFNGVSGGRKLGGALNSFLSVTEIWA